MHLNAGGETRGAQLLEALLDGGTHLGDVGLGRSGYQNAQGTLSVVGHGVAHRLLDTLLHLGNVRDAQLVHLMTLDEHAADIAHCLELVRHSDAHTLVSVIVIAGIRGLVLAVECRKHLCRRHAQGGEFVLKKANLDALVLGAVDLNPLDVVQTADFVAQQIAVLQQLALRESVGGQGVEHAVNGGEVVSGDGNAGT